MHLWPTVDMLLYVNIVFCSWTTCEVDIDVIGFVLYDHVCDLAGSINSQAYISWDSVETLQTWIQFPWGHLPRRRNRLNNYWDFCSLTTCFCVTRWCGVYEWVFWALMTFNSRHFYKPPAVTDYGGYRHRTILRVWDINLRAYMNTANSDTLSDTPANTNPNLCK